MMDGFDTLASSAIPSIATNPGAPQVAGIRAAGSGGGPSSSSSWMRSLSELAAVNRSTINNNVFETSGGGGANLGPTSQMGFSTISPGPTGAALMVATTTGDGPQPFQTSAASTSHTSSYISSDSSSFVMEGGVDDVVRRRRGVILERLLKEQEQRTQRLVDQTIQTKLAQEWAMEREWWRADLIGNRNLGSSSSSSTSANGGSNGKHSQSLHLPSTANSLLMTNDQSTNTAGSEVVQAAQEHFDIVNKMIIEPTSKNGAGSMGYQPHLLNIIEAFENLPSTLQSTLNGGVGGGYQNAWKIISAMIPRIQNKSGAEKAVEAACGALVHYCEQYSTIITNKVKEAAAAGIDVSSGSGTGPTRQQYSDEMANTVAIYTRLVVGSGSGVWSKLYYCIRCGDFNAAKVILDVDAIGSGSFPEYAILSKVIGQLSNEQRGQPCLFQSGGPIIDDADRSIVKDYMEKTQNLEPNATFKLNVLALLAGYSIPSSDTVEDYMYGSLWMALLDMKNPVEKLIELGASIKQFGPQYFGNVWGYCLPLLACQQFKTALVHLQSTGSMGLLQAAHVSIIFDHADVLADDLKSQAASVESQALISTSGSASTGRESHPAEVSSGLLVNYAQLLEQTPAIADSCALPYLLLVPNEDTQRVEIASLITRAGATLYKELAGTPDENGYGRRQDSVLDLYLPEIKSSSILDMAASMCKKQSSDTLMAERSANLYLLAGSYASAISLLNELVSPPDDFSESKMYWSDQSTAFFRQYLERSTAVLNKIQQEGKESLMKSLRSLLELRNFFANIREQKYEAALDLIGKIGILPRSDKEVDEKASKYLDFDRSLQKAFPAAIVGTTKCLFEIYRQYKSDPGSNLPTGQARLKELQLQVRILFIFSGLIEMSSDLKREISQMKAGMV